MGTWIRRCVGLVFALNLANGERKSGNGISVEKVSEQTIMGEGPHWDSSKQVLYYVDIQAGSIHSYNPESNEHSSASITSAEKPVTLILPIGGYPNQYVVSLGRELAVITWDSDSASPQEIAVLDEDKSGNRINDGKADAMGRIFAGTIQSLPNNDGNYPPVGSLYSITNEQLKKQIDGVTCSNGLAWSKDNRKFYYADSFIYKIKVFDYDLETATLSNPRVLFDLKEQSIPGFADGLTIDVNDNIFVANFGGAQVLHINGETGELISKIPIPTLQVTSVAFGGRNLDELYVTTTSIHFDGFELTPEQRENAGNVYRVTGLGTMGLPANNVDYNTVF